MKNKHIKILTSLTLIVAMLFSYVQVIAVNLPAVGKAGDNYELVSKAFKGGSERTGKVPSSNYYYDKQGYKRYKLNISGINPPSGTSANEIQIKDIASKMGFEHSSFYCLDPTKAFPIAETGTKYISRGTLDDPNLSDQDLSRITGGHKSITKEGLKNIISKFYLSNTIGKPIEDEGVAEHAPDLYKKISIRHKEAMLSKAVDGYNSLDKIYQFTTDDDLKIIEQSIIWHYTSNGLIDTTDTGNIIRDLENGTPEDDTPGDNAYKIDRNAYFKKIVNGFNDNPSQVIKPPTIVKDEFTYVKGVFSDTNKEYVDYGIMKITTSEPELIYNVTVKDLDGNIIPDSDYQVIIGTREYMGTDEYVNPLSGNLKDNLKTLSTSKPFFLRLTNPNNNLKGIEITFEFVSGINTIGEILEPVEPTQHQAVIKIDREPILDKVVIRSERQISDIALRKFITHINGNSVVSREPKLSQEKETVERRQTTAYYAHRKDPLVVKPGDTITYKMRLYNETLKPASPTSVIDILPKGLTLKTGEGINVGWEKIKEFPDGREVIKCSNIPNLPILGAKALDGGNFEIQYREISVDLVVDKDAPTGIQLTNIAFVNTQNEEDPDSIPGNITKDGKDIYEITNDMLPSYRGNGNDGTTLEQDTHYFKGYEDDDDFEKVILIPFDLALRKHIMQVNGQDLDIKDKRDLNINTKPLKDATATTSEFPPKEKPVKVSVGDVVTYKMRIYNEGGLSRICKTDRR